MRKQLFTLCTCLFLTACTAPAGPGQQQTAQRPAEVQAQPAAQAEKQTTQVTAPEPAPAPQPAVQPAQTDPPPAPRYTIDAKHFRIKSDKEQAEKIVLLTIDDGPTGKSTTELLDALDRHQAKAIWFVNGHQLAKKRKDGTYQILPEKAALLKEIHSRGHLIGNHTWWHENLRKLSPEQQREEILSTNQVVEAITGSKPAFFRPPFGADTDISRQICEEEGMQSVNWSVGSLDWDASVYKKPNGITQQVLDTIHNGGNILFHDRTWTAAEMDQLLTKLKQAGYTFVLPTESP